MSPLLSATNPCGPELGTGSGYSLMWPVAGSSRPSLLAFCPVYQREPSGATAGSWGRDCGVGRAYSLIVTLSGLTAAKAKATISNAGRADTLRMTLTSTDYYHARRGVGHEGEFIEARGSEVQSAAAESGGVVAAIG